MNPLRAAELLAAASLPGPPPPATVVALLLASGLLLLLVECLRPGWVLPGSLGLLLALVGLHRLALLPQHRLLFALLTGSAVQLGLGALPWSAAPRRMACLGAVATAAVSGELLQSPGAPLLFRVAGGIAGGGLGLLLSALVAVAVRARTNKRRPNQVSNPSL